MVGYQNRSWKDDGNSMIAKLWWIKIFCIIVNSIDSNRVIVVKEQRSKSDVAHEKAEFFPAEFTADFWYLSVVTGANEHQSRPPTTVVQKVMLIKLVFLYIIY
jgi:hypothetical protein